MNRSDFEPLIIAALQTFPGQSAKLWQVCEHIWINHGQRIMRSGNLLYTWQYDVRWAADKLRKDNRLVSVPRGNWTLI